MGTEIIKKLKHYNTDTITSIFPDYFIVIKPKLTDIKQSVAILRSDKKINSENSFSKYFDQITELIDIDKKVDVMIPSLQEYQSKKKREARIGWVIAFILGLLPSLILYFISK